MYTIEPEFILIERRPASSIRLLMDAVSRKTRELRLPGFIQVALAFFDMPVSRKYKTSRIIRRYNKTFEDFIFKGYDQQQPGLSRPGSFKKIRRICKN